MTDHTSCSKCAALHHCKHLNNCVVWTRPAPGLCFPKRNMFLQEVNYSCDIAARSGQHINLQVTLLQ